MGFRKIAFGVSAILSILGLLCAVMVYTGHANMGIDFAGGASANFEFQKPIDSESARKAMDAAGFKDAEIQTFTGGTRILVRVKNTNIPIEQVVDRMQEGFTKAFPGNPVRLDSSSAIGPTVGKALQKDALKAIIISILLIILYIAWRFEFKFGIAASIATFHDVLAVMGIFLLLHKEITLLVVTALLTVAGYSLTDTVVVFDRIRENLRLKQKDNLLDIINASVNEVLSRTIVTSMTAFLTVVALFLIGGEVLHDFAFAMMIGIIVGTYSSVFVASPLLYIWRGKKGGRLIKVTMLGKQQAPKLESQLAKAAAAAPVNAAPDSSEDAGAVQGGKRAAGRGQRKARGKSKA